LFENVCIVDVLQEIFRRDQQMPQAPKDMKLATSRWAALGLSVNQCALIVVANPNAPLS
jgi:hypothetical protein